MSADNYSWRVEAVVPKELPDGRMGRLNLNLQVIAPSLEVAMTAVKAAYPQIDFIKVMRDRFISQVIVASGSEGEGMTTDNDGSPSESGV